VVLIHTRHFFTVFSLFFHGTLFKLDATDFKIEAEKATIKIKLKENKVAQLRVSSEKDQDRLAAVIKNTLLSKAEFYRFKDLYENDQVGTLSDARSDLKTARLNINRSDIIGIKKIIWGQK